MKPLSKLRRLFSNKSNVIQTRSGTAKLPGRSLHPHWIVGRDLCMYRHEDFANVPRSRRRSALALKLPVWSPFERTGHHCVWSGSAAMVWFWDEDAIGAGPASAGPASAASADPDASRAQASRAGPGPGARVRVLPETVFHPRKPGGLHLQACREGFELQYWRSDVLADAFWFPGRPDEPSLSWFLERQGADAGAAPSSLPAVTGARMASEPWSAPVRPGEWLAANERTLVAVCLLALALAVVWQEARFWKIRHLGSTVASELARLQDELGPLLDARNELLRLRRTNRALSELLAQPSQARLMGVMDRALPSPQAQFREWRFQQGGLEVVVEDPDLDPISYVRSLEASEPLFGRAARAADPALAQAEQPDPDYAGGAGMNVLDRTLRPAVAELAGNARLRWGVWLILGLVLLYCVLLQSDRVAVVHDDYAAEAERLARAEVLLARRDWPELLEAERGVHRTLETAFWQAETEGLAQAKLQAALAGTLEGLDLDQPLIRSGVSQPVPGLPWVWRVQTRLDTAFRPGMELRMLHALATHPKKLIVDRLDLRRRTRQDSYMTLILSAYFVGVGAERQE